MPCIPFQLMFTGACGSVSGRGMRRKSAHIISGGSAPKHLFVLVMQSRVIKYDMQDMQTIAPDLAGDSRAPGVPATTASRSARPRRTRC